MVGNEKRNMIVNQSMKSGPPTEPFQKPALQESHARGRGWIEKKKRCINSKKKD